MIGATAVAIGVVAAVMTAYTVRQVGCQPVSSPIQAAPQAVIVGVLAALSYGFGGLAAMREATRGRTLAAVAMGAATFGGVAALSVAFVFIALFPALRCAAPH